MTKKIAFAVFVAFVLLNVALVTVALVSTRDRDLSVADTAIEWQEAVFGGNYEAMWDLSAPEFRDGRSRDEFISQVRQSAPPQDRLFDWTALNEKSGDIARVHTRVQLVKGDIETHRMLMRNIGGEWRVTEYEAYEGSWPPNEPPLASS